MTSRQIRRQAARKALNATEPGAYYDKVTPEKKTNYFTKQLSTAETIMWTVGLSALMGVLVYMYIS